MPTNDTFVLGATQSFELQQGFRKAGYEDKDVKALSNPGFLSRVLRVIRGEATVRPITKEDFSVWKTIKGGVKLKTPKDLKKAGFQTDTYAEQLLEKVTVASESTELDLVAVTSQDLGFTENALRAVIYERARSFGLQPCPDWVGPELRWQYADQPKDEWLRIGMDSDSGEVFRVAHTSHGLCLLTSRVMPFSVCNLDELWVFVKPRNN